MLLWLAGSSMEVGGTSLANILHTSLCVSVMCMFTHESSSSGELTWALRRAAGVSGIIASSPPGTGFSRICSDLPKKLLFMV